MPSVNIKGLGKVNFPATLSPEKMKSVLVKNWPDMKSALTGELGDIPNPLGGVSTEKSITITDPRINQGRPTNIPTLIQGQPQDAIQRILTDQAIQEDNETAILRAIKRTEGGSYLPYYDSIDNAVAAAKVRTDTKSASKAAIDSTEPNQIQPLINKDSIK